MKVMDIPKALLVIETNPIIMKVNRPIEKNGNGVIILTITNSILAANDHHQIITRLVPVAIGMMRNITTKATSPR